MVREKGRNVSHPSDTFEVHGYYEELTVRIGERIKFLGTRDIDDPSPRQLGIAGAVEYRFEQDLELDRGHKRVTVRASKEKPIRARGVAQAKCGRALRA